MANYHYATINNQKVLVCPSINVLWSVKPNGGICPSEKIIQKAITDGCVALVANVTHNKQNYTGSIRGWSKIDMTTIQQQINNNQINTSPTGERQVIIPLTMLTSSSAPPAKQTKAKAAVVAPVPQVVSTDDIVRRLQEEIIKKVKEYSKTTIDYVNGMLKLRSLLDIEIKKYVKPDNRKDLQ